MQISYKDSFRGFVKSNLTQFYVGVGPFYSARNKDRSPDSLTYFNNHYDRFEAMIDLCVKNGVQYLKIASVAELGSFYPYVSYYFKCRNPEVTIDLYDIILREHCAPGTVPYNVDGVRLIDFNFCIDEFSDVKYDLIFLSEVMEHLPINLFSFAKKVIGILKPGGFLLVTYPLHGKNARDYGTNLKGYDYTKLQEDHIREFTSDKVNLFFKDLTKVAEEEGRFKAYGKIKLVLYVK